MSLATFNRLVGAAHAAQAVAIPVLAGDAALPVTAEFLTRPPRGREPWVRE